MRRAASARQRCGPGTFVSRSNSADRGRMNLLFGKFNVGGNNDVNVLFVSAFCDGTDSGQGLDGKLMPTSSDDTPGLPYCVSGFDDANLRCFFAAPTLS